MVLLPVLLTSHLWLDQYGVLENYHTGSLQSQELSEIPTTASKLKNMKNKLIEKVRSDSK